MPNRDRTLAADARRLLAGATGSRRALALTAAVALLVAAALAAAIVALSGGDGGGDSGHKGSWAPAPDTVGGLQRVARTAGERFLLQTAGGNADFIAGVNIGSTIPGRQPGELAIPAQVYRRWLEQIGALGFHSIRVYTILTPGFYEELAAYNNAHQDAPLYLLQGVWIPEAQFLATQDLFDPAVRAGFQTELRDTAAAVHGDLVRPHQLGIASGDWTADVSPWLLAYSIGVEWDPVATKASDTTNAGVAAFDGKYFSSAEGATPTEIWLAEMLDTIAAAEAARGRTMPLTFTNWPTTDALRHPEEPLGKEDLVGVDATHIKVARTWPGGYFASYHAYPYYPDFQRHEPDLQKYQYQGRSDPYAGYLAALRAHYQGMPLMITEFGVPSSMALAHTGPLGRNQGDHSEQEALRIDAELLRLIKDQGACGGFVFEWTDEWFKFTWNTIDYELPGDRRQLWVNPWTNEEHFGLIATDPGKQAVVVVDGKGDEWQTNASQVIYEGRKGIREVRAIKDEGYLYLRLVVDDPTLYATQPLTLGFDVIPGGNGGLPGYPGRDPAADYAAVLGPGLAGQMFVAAANDQYVIRYGKVRKYFAFDAAGLLPGSGVWDLERLVTNRPFTIPTTGERLPAESFDAGNLRYGSSDPAAADFDSRSVWAVGEVIEIRLPYMAIGFSDPSSLQGLRIAPGGAVSTVDVPLVGISIAQGSKFVTTRGYTWEPWNAVTWHERPKAGLDGFAAMVREVSGD